MKPAILLAAALVVGATQTSSQSFAGTWTAEHAGQTFVRLELEGAGAALAGRISLGDIHLGKNGEVETARAASRNPTPIIDVAERAGKLTFAHRDGRDTDRFEMKLIDATTAELTFVLTDAARKELVSQGIAEFKPVRLKKLARD
jgi:hypothetical protein